MTGCSRHAEAFADHAVAFWLNWPILMISLSGVHDLEGPHER
jgi:hypothetical protein